ncbi:MULTISPECIES: error-prone DNA polymerase [Actinotignum]|uniref:Error-prone DNA polymerase n=2 Tax=Actinotignum TaxID=1653174 RepID=A0AAW9HHN6_9ACTO|nr:MULTISPECIES: error-prone DNA polymerase [Actinotignum]MDE1558432.1 error-prone DNA polymerase [Actinotignum schaalii]MDE1662994.1 error-prone DNA polymerase [Actinotignum schaalii]MDK6372907.1 error-prone DNA polymerase [Actinotignum timonense]MDK6418712.1 error-prone DNA polymerase [Actinotignum timonense]MDK6645518.1 error-prone DNA polymerase [Actinotignum timonense]
MTTLITSSPYVPYAELHAHSAFSFLDGASLPEDLVQGCLDLRIEALALTDHDGFPGVMQLAQAGRDTGLPTITGTEITLDSTQPREGPDPEGGHLVFLARTPAGYQHLSRAIGTAMLASGTKGIAHHTLAQLARNNGDILVLTGGCRKSTLRRILDTQRGSEARRAARQELDLLISTFGKDNVVVELTSHAGPLDAQRCDLLEELARETGVRAAVTGNVHYAHPADRPIADIFAATRARCTLDEIDPYLPAAGAHLRSGHDWRILHRGRERYLEAAARIAEECAFDLSLVKPNLPPFPVPEGYTEATWLRELVLRKARERYGTPADYPRAWEVIEHELEVITQLGFPGYFLIVEEIVAFCHSRNIWCQGRGSAANSAVCFALGITAVDAVKHAMLFERFLSPGRSGPPDIDIDIESSRREEVIQHVYERYGRSCAAQVANVISYRPRFAIRDVARAFGYPEDHIDQWASAFHHRSISPGGGAQPQPAGLPERVAALATRIQQLPRHLGIHASGMVLCDRPVIDVCPVGWASKPGRTVLQWDKDDCATAGLVKFDLLGLGMLTALRISFTELTRRGILAPNGQPLGLHNVPSEDPEVYALLQAADTVGVFQVESRAQIATLPRLKPECFYDLVIEVALIRPGPIQGGSVNPYLRRKQGKEKVTYPHPLLKNALEKTLGVPLFQEQLMHIAIDAAGFTPAQADQLRKAMGSKRSAARMERLRGQLMEGMEKQGITDPEVRAEIYEKLAAFAEFGFPESHAFSFAYLVYASAWLKVHHPEEFYMGLLNAQPMGFYSPQSLVADARRHHLVVRRADVTRSHEHARVEELPDTQDRPKREHPRIHVDSHRYLQLGLSSIKGLGNAAIQRILTARARAPFRDLADLAQRARLKTADIEILSRAGATDSLGVSRREGVWIAQAVSNAEVVHGTTYQPAIPGTEPFGAVPELPELTAVEQAHADLRATGISPDSYPTQFIRPALTARGILTVTAASTHPEKSRCKVAGLVTHRQRPHTAKGITFLNLEDETGMLNVLITPQLWERYREIARTSNALVIRGMVERDGGAAVFHADGIEAIPLGINLPSRDFR